MATEAGAQTEPPAVPPAATSPVPFVLSVALLALAIQVGAALLAPKVADFGKYPLAARQWLADQLPAERLADLSPLYFELNVALVRLGLEPRELLPPLQMVAAALAVGLIAWRLRQRRIARWLAVVAAAAMACDHQLLIYARVLEPEALLLLAVCAWLALLDRPEGRGRLLVAGAWGAIGILLRPTLLPLHWLFVPVLLALRPDPHYELEAAGARPQARRMARWARDTAIYLLPLLLAGLWSSARLARALGDSAPSMSPGTVFYEGNHPVSNGTSAVYPPMVRLLLAHSESRGADGGHVPDAGHVLYREIARQQLGGSDASIGEVNRFWAQRALAFIGDHPWTAWRLLATKLRYALHGFTWHDVPSAADLELRMSWPALPFSLLGTLALLFLASHARDWRTFLPDLALFATQLAVLLVFYVSGRQRLILLPVVVVFAAQAVNAWPAMRRRPRLLGIALVVLLTLTLMLPDDAQRDESYRARLALRAGAARAEMFEALGARYFVEVQEEVAEVIAFSAWQYEDTRPAEVAQAALLAAASDRLEQQLPTFSASDRPFAEFDLAALELAAGRPEAAAERATRLADHGIRAFRGSAETSEPRVLQARALVRLGRHDEARAALLGGLERSPGDPFALAELLVLTGDARYGETLTRYYSEVDADWLVGRAALGQGRPEIAYTRLAAVHARFPRARRVLLELAGACADRGLDEEGVAHLRESLRLAPVPVADAAKVVPMVERWAARHPETGARQLAIALLLQHGAFESADAILGQLPPALLETPLGRRAQDLVAKARAARG